MKCGDQKTYFWIEFVDTFNSHLQISTVYRLSNLDSFLDIAKVHLGLDVCLRGKLFSS